MLHIIYGTQRACLRTYCLRSVNQHMARWPDRRAVLLVPEQSKMDMERDFLNQEGQTGLMLADVLSFRRLAWRLLSEAGQQPRQAVDPLGQAILVQEILKKRRPELHVFGRLADKPGFVREFTSVLGDFRRYQVTASQIEQAGKACPDLALSNKLADFSLVMCAYEEALGEARLTDTESDLRRLADLLEKLSQEPGPAWPWPCQALQWLGWTRIWINGFGELRSFTPLEMRLIKALDQLAEAVVVTIAADCIPDRRQAVDLGPDCFLPGRRTGWQLSSHLQVASVQAVQEEKEMTARNCLGQAVLSNRVEPFQPEEDPEKYQACMAFLKLVSAPGPDQEVNWVAGEIRRLVQCENYRYRDIVIAACDLAVYGPRLRLAARTYGLPFFLDSDRSLSGTPLMRLVLSLLDIERTGWSRPALMAYLRTGLLSARQEDVDRLENHWLAWGLFRSDRIFAARYDDPERGVDPDLPHLRDRLLRPVRDLLRRLRRNSSGQEKCRILQAFLLEQGIKDQTEQHINRLLDLGDMENAVILAKSWNELDRLMQQMVQLHAKEAMNLEAFRDHLAAGMEAAQAGVIPTAIDQVSIGDLRHGLLRQPRVLFLVGAKSGSLPPSWPPEGLLKDQDRQILAGQLECELPSRSADQAFADSFMIYSLLTLPADKLYLTVPDQETSTWFNRLADWLPGAVQVLDEEPAAADSRLNAFQPALTGWLKQQRSQAAAKDPAWDQLGRLLRQSGTIPWQQVRHWLDQAAPGKQPRYTAASLSPALVAALYGQNITLSVSQLEQYAGCPFRHLALSLLRLRERPGWQPQAADLGTALHRVAEMALAELSRELEAILPEDRPLRQQILQTWLDRNLEHACSIWFSQAAASTDALRWLQEKGLQASWGRRTRRLAAASIRGMLTELLQEDYQPQELEWLFGPGRPHSYSLDLPGQQPVWLRGIIDRIDRLRSGERDMFRIIDYKSGRKGIDFDALYHGLDLQLPVYLAAYQGSHPEMIAAEAAYMHFDRPMIRLEHGGDLDPDRLAQQLQKQYAADGLNASPQQLQQLIRHSSRRAGNWVESLLAGQFSASPARIRRKTAPCTWCQMFALCRFEGSQADYRWLPELKSVAEPGGRVNRRSLFWQCLDQEEDSL